MKQDMKNFIKRYPALFRFLRGGYRRAFPPVQPKKLLQVPVQEQIENTLAKKPSVFFVQVGSNDGAHGDPLHELIIQHDEWRGIFVEPVKFLFERLKHNYKNANRFVFENVAVGSEEKVTKFYYVGEEAKKKLGDKLPYWYDQLGSFDRNHILKHLNGKLEPYIVEEEVECIPLRKILERNNVHAIDLFHVDAEGFDYQVISQLPFGSFKPSIILYEHTHLSVDEKEKARALLMTEGYQIVEVEGDMLATLKV